MRFPSIPIRDIMNEAVRLGAVIVDVRDATEFLTGHIPMSVNVPIADIQTGRYSLPKKRPIIVYCSHGGSSALAAKILTRDGYQVINTVGGLAGYRGALTRGR